MYSIMRINFELDKHRVQDTVTFSFVTVQVSVLQVAMSVTNGEKEKEKEKRKREAEKGLFLNRLGCSRILLYFLGAEKSQKWKNCVIKSHPQRATLLRIQMSKYYNLVSSFTWFVYFILFKSYQKISSHLPK